MGSIYCNCERLRNASRGVNSGKKGASGLLREWAKKLMRELMHV
jgi:hypothetical protein